MLDEEDQETLRGLKQRHPSIIRDLWNYLNPDDRLIYGCPAVNLFYVNPLGDILPCPYIHAKLGNIREETLKEIIDRGFAVRKFREHSDKCLVGEDREFAEKYLDRDMSILEPIPIRDLFPEEECAGKEDIE